MKLALNLSYFRNHFCETNRNRRSTNFFVSVSWVTQFKQYLKYQTMLLLAKITLKENKNVILKMGQSLRAGPFCLHRSTGRHRSWVEREEEWELCIYFSQLRIACKSRFHLWLYVKYILYGKIKYSTWFYKGGKCGCSILKNKWPSWEQSAYVQSDCMCNPGPMFISDRSFDPEC